MKLFTNKFYPGLVKAPVFPSIEKVRDLLPKVKSNKAWDYYWELGIKTVKELETDQGILASGRNEVFGAIFGRDSLITSLKLLKVYQQTGVEELLPIVRKVLLNLVSLQGQEVNIESGEEPGKCIHEYRPDNHERLTKASPDKPWLERPWYVYPDGTLRSYDSVDATPLFLIALYRYYQISKDELFLSKVLVSAEKALNWLILYADSNHDGFIDFRLNPERKSGGLVNQNWMDSSEAVFHEDGLAVTYPLAPVEAQAYTFLALRLWSKFFLEKDSVLAEQLFARAYVLKQRFNEDFVISQNGQRFLAYALDASGKPLTSIRSNMGHVLWSSLDLEDDGELESIVNTENIGKIVDRLFQPDLFVKEAGIRTLSSFSRNYDPNSYHNGSIWPHDNSMIIEGLERWGYSFEAQAVKKALLSAFAHFQTPVELFVYDEGYKDYLAACRTQAWSAAAILKIVAKDYAKERKKLSSRALLKRLTSKALDWFFVYN